MVAGPCCEKSARHPLCFCLFKSVTVIYKGIEEKNCPPHILWSRICEDFTLQQQYLQLDLLFICLVSTIEAKALSFAGSCCLLLPYPFCDIHLQFCSLCIFTFCGFQRKACLVALLTGFTSHCPILHHHLFPHLFH